MDIFFKLMMEIRYSRKGEKICGHIYRFETQVFHDWLIK